MEEGGGLSGAGAGGGYRSAPHHGELQEKGSLYSQIEKMKYVEWQKCRRERESRMLIQGGKAKRATETFEP